MTDETPQVPIAGTRLGAPLARLTQIDVGEQSALRMWEGIERRLTEGRGASSLRARVELRWVLAGCERADSIVVNPHKWLFTPVDCSILWVRDPALLRAATATQG